MKTIKEYKQNWEPSSTAMQAREQLLTALAEKGISHEIEFGIDGMGGEILVVKLGRFAFTRTVEEVMERN